MQIKNRTFLFITIFLNIFLFNLNLIADEFNMTADEVTVDKKNDILIGKGSVKVTDLDGHIITADKITYKKSEEFLTAEGSVKVLDKEKNLITSNKITYDKINEIILTRGNSKIILQSGYNLTSSDILYKVISKMMSSQEKSIFTDIDGNIVYVDMFQYQIDKDLFSSIGNIKVIDINKNKYFFKEVHIDTKKYEMIGSDVSVLLDQENFGVDKNNDPRFVANDIFLNKNKSDISKGVFTICKKRDGRCPPWSLTAKKISHDKIKKNIYYKNAVLKLYDVPIFYFPRFYHPDPTVKRASGFLAPFFTDSTTVGTGFGLPYFWAISHDKDLTITPKTYANENILILNEYRQAFRNGFLTLDTSYTEGYKETSSKKTDGSRSHVFGELDFDLGKDKSYESKLSFKTQRVSNDTYLRIHDINTTLVDSNKTNLENKILYTYSKENSYLNMSAEVYEDINDKSNDRYEYILPNILYGKTFFTDNIGAIDISSNAIQKNYDGNKYTTMLTNDIIWKPVNSITKSGFVNTIEGMMQNHNYEAKNTEKLKTDGLINELSSVISLKSSLPMKKEGVNFSNFFSPNFMIRYAPGHMRDLSGDNSSLNYANLYNVNKSSVIEDGLSAILGFDYKTNKKEQDGSLSEKLSVSLGQVFNYEENRDIPSKTSLDQKMSDVVGEIKYNFSEIGLIDYKFSLDHNLNTLNYNEISTSLNFGKIDFNLDYLEERNHVGTEHYVNSGITLNLNDKSKFGFSTKKNFKTDSTELYDISYQYSIDCLKAGLVYRREFYEDVDNDIEPKNSLMFTITFVPFGGVKTPSFINP
tara:strand:+ start:7534 stop:9969 length:2436 start_codon:yes stop_codon:yes gene_type:complete